MRTGRVVGIGVALCALATAACSSDARQRSLSTTGPQVVSGQSFPAQRCADNRSAGPITYTSGYDYAAAAGIVDVLVAKQRGYFDAVCLDVRVEAGLSSANDTAVASGDTQFSSAGSFSELAGTPARRSLGIW